MSGKPDYIKKKYGPLKDKNMINALAHCIKKEFPRMGGPRIIKLCAELVLGVVNAHLRPLEYVKHGEALWLAVSVDDPPTRGKRIADTDLVPVVLTLNTPEDIDRIIARRSPAEKLEHIIVRLCKQAYEQGALLSNCDLSVILNISDSRVSQTLTNYERWTGKVVPRRATTHDVGTGLTHKRIICRKKYMEGKTSKEIAREVYHSMEAVDRYLEQYKRVKYCKTQNMTPEETAFALNCSISLVNEYLKIYRELDDENV